MSREGAPRSNVVDLRRWREERERRLRAAEGEAEAAVRPLGERFRAVLDRRVHPLPVLSGISALVLTLGLWGGPKDPVLWEPAIFWFVGFLHVALHETGHLLAVCGMRYTPLRLVAGPLLVEWEAGRRRVTANRDWRFLFGGNVWFSAAHRSRARDLVVLLAGPLANLLALGTVLAVHRLLGGPALFGSYVRANAVCTGAVLLTNLLPLPRTREGYATDGRQILDLLRGRRIA
jgi:peptidase M50-like protein